MARSRTNERLRETFPAWLTGAIESSLGQPNTIGVEPYRILSFRRILRDATTRGSFRRVIGAFVEATGGQIELDAKLG